VTRALQQEFDKLVSGRHVRSAAWLRRSLRWIGGSAMSSSRFSVLRKLANLGSKKVLLRTENWN